MTYESSESFLSDMRKDLEQDYKYEITCMLAIAKVLKQEFEREEGNLFSYGEIQHSFHAFCVKKLAKLFRESDKLTKREIDSFKEELWRDRKSWIKKDKSKRTFDYPASYLVDKLDIDSYEKVKSFMLLTSENSLSKTKPMHRLSKRNVWEKELEEVLMGCLMKNVLAEYY
jgi:hypothetical protein